MARVVLTALTMRLQLTKDRTIDISLPGTGGGAVADVTGLELYGGDAHGVPAVRIVRRKSAWQLQAAGFVKGPEGGLPQSWEESARPDSMTLPAPFRAPHAALAVNSPYAIFTQSTADSVLQDMARGLPDPQAAAAEPVKRRLAIRRPAAPKPPQPSLAAAVPAAPAKLPEPGVPTAFNGMRFTVKPLAEENIHLEAALPEFQTLWLSRLLPEGHRPTAASIQVADAALMASVLAQPALKEADGNALVMFVRSDRVFFAGYKGGRPVLWRRCPVRGGYLAMHEAVKRGLGVDDSMVTAVLEDNLVDPRSALESFIHPVLSELELSRAYLAGKHSLKLDRVLLMGLPAGAKHWCEFAREFFWMDMTAPGVFDGLVPPPRGEIAADGAYLTALGAALAATEAET